MIIAIDGPAGSGKSTVAKLLAKKLGYLYIDTGAMYRAFTLKTINEGIDTGDQGRIIEILKSTSIDFKDQRDNNPRTYLDGADVSIEIRDPRVTSIVSDISKISKVREIMCSLQRDIAREKDIVMEGRDIGTVVFPYAEMKFFIDADFKERVRRRHKELLEQDVSVTEQAIGEDLENRDRIDSTREIAPLKKADDAVCLDTTNMTIEEVVDVLLSRVKKRDLNSHKL